MIDAALLPFQRRLLDRPARWLKRRGINANQITLAGFGVGIIAVPALAYQMFCLALLAIAINRILDGLDGAVARAGQPTDRGAFLDITLDFVFYALVPLGFAFADPAQNALPAAILITSFVGTGSSFLAFAVIAGQRGLRPQAYPTKGIYYLGGLAEGAETIAVFMLMCLLPNKFPLLAYIFSFVCAVTTVTRWFQGWRVFSAK